ncbi:AAA-ATPase At3g28610-like [Triticum dicoccoides]|uniref:AAA-ATPase At3g28610-like n=1 Tax=Triticum dicoccoides TaxID=85692 RepID=UPI000E79FA32|nr:AAA-ATPase At3g28610-like [Triticum dicoccoides]
MREGQDEVADEFRGVTIWWSALKEDDYDMRRCCRLTFHQRHRKLIVDEYLPHVRRCGRAAMSGTRRRRLHTNKTNLSYSASRKDVWSYIDFHHPTTFETLAMHPDKKQMIIDDLNDFRSSEDYYLRIGKAWKRGYLLYGPPGTGKSTMIAAMANYLNYDVYDIELTTLKSNNDLRKLFIETTGKSIIVIEDIDCSLNLTGSRAAMAQPKRADGAPKKGSIVTLSGLLNFIDGIWSAHSGERIIVFTTNHLDKLDAALIRRGRMDLHIEMSYCGFEAFKTLAKNYIGVDAHPLFATLEELLQAAQITPADVAECLMASRRSSRDIDACMSRLVDELIKTAKISTTADDDDKDDVSLKRAKDNVEIRDAAAKPNGGSDGSSDIGDGCGLGDGSDLEDDCSSYDSDDSY